MSKLTLNIDAEIIEAAKAYSRQRGISLSKLVTRYLAEVVESPHDDFIEQLHRELETEGYTPPKDDIEELRQRHIKEKYL